jgi:hypothetical protein
VARLRQRGGKHCHRGECRFSFLIYLSSLFYAHTSIAHLIS